MKEKELNHEQRRLKLRRRLLKLGAYSIPAIATILTTEKAYAVPQYKNQPQGVKRGGNIS